MTAQNQTEEPVMGMWSAYSKLTPQDKEIFEEALEGFVGINYRPLTVSTQVIEGTNYHFKCMACLPPNAVMWEALIKIYKPLKGKPQIKGITKL